jgi:FkbM family methyltransferase
MFIRLPQAPELTGPTDGGRAYLGALRARRTAVQRKLRRGGLASFEPVTQATLLTLVQQASPDAVLFDVGAHIGLFSALVTSVLDRYGVRAYAFEPSPETLAVARRLRDHNHLAYDIVGAALSSTRGNARLYLSDRAETSYSLNAAWRAHASSVQVPCTTLDAFVAHTGVTPHVVKIDVGTHEGDVLTGALDTIASSRPWIVCEILLPTTDPALVRALGRLTDEGYEFHQLSPGMPWPRVQLSSAGVRADEGRNWVLTPKPLDDGFYATCGAWLDAVARCTADTNRYSSVRTARRGGRRMRRRRPPARP